MKNKKPKPKPKVIKPKHKPQPKTTKQPIEPKCKNCLLYNREAGECKVAILVNGKEYHMPVFPEDRCHMDELGIAVEQVRWFVVDPKTGKPTKGNGVVKMEYPEGFFGEKKEETEEDELDL